MDELVNDEQRSVLDASSQFAAKMCPIPRLRDRVHESAEFRSNYWKRSAELGWFSMLVPESLDGGSASGNGVLDAALIAYTLGRALQPGPFVSTNVVVHALAVTGTPEQQELLLPGLISGEEAAAWAVNSGGSCAAPDSGVAATPTASGYELNGHESFVQDVDWADWVLVTAASGQGLRQFVIPIDAPGITVRARKSLDLTRQFFEITFNATPAKQSELLTEQGQSAAAMDRQLAIAAILTAAQTVGTVSEALDRTVQYAKDRIAFGRPIGSFQAIKHLLVDASLSLELAKSVVLAAATALGSVDTHALQAASMAKSFVGDIGIDIVSNCTQVFGGIGLTWEHDQHLFVRRVTTDAALYGDPVWHRERLCQLAGI